MFVGDNGEAEVDFHRERRGWGANSGELLHLWFLGDAGDLCEDRGADEVLRFI